MEVDIYCHNELSIKDYRIGATIYEIINLFLSDSCNGIMYRCSDHDGKQCKRELQFDRWRETFDEDEKLDVFAQTLCDEEEICVKYYLLVDKGCLSYESIVDDFNNECKHCNSSKNNDEEC
ncbi:MAG: hypothetical protein IPL31_00160 [Saprospiraceae bacterium]|nr:hypothetical protein [Saprospiraceae bacterium]